VLAVTITSAPVTESAELATGPGKAADASDDAEGVAATATAGVRGGPASPSDARPHSNQDWVALDPMLGAVVVSQQRIAHRVIELGQQITEDYADRPPLLVGVLKGAFVFLADLSRAIELPLEMDFMAVASYGTATKTSGVVRIVKDLDLDLTGRHVIVVEDIVDSGLTLSYLRKSLLARGPESLAICTLLLKTGQQRANFDVEYIGFEIEPYFVVGYGLDVAERYRNLADLRVYVGGEPS
jgi:hypoxanthine phosphoribosyltransferase